MIQIFDLLKIVTTLLDAEILAAFITGVCTIVGAVIAVQGVRKTIELMNVASKTFMTTDDIYRVLASLRYQPHNVESDGCDFKSMTKKIYKELNEMLDTKYNRKIKQKLSEKPCFKSKDYTIYIEYIDSKIIRLYTKYLLKHHWEINIDENIWLKNQKEVIEEVKELRNNID